MYEYIHSDMNIRIKREVKKIWNSSAPDFKSHLRFGAFDFTIFPVCCYSTKSYDSFYDKFSAIAEILVRFKVAYVSCLSFFCGEIST